MLQYIIWYACYVIAIILGIRFRKINKVFLVMGIIKLARAAVVIFLTLTSWNMYRKQSAFDRATIAGLLQNNLKTIIICCVLGAVFLILWRVTKKKYPDTPLSIKGGRKALFIIALAVCLLFLYSTAQQAEAYRYRKVNYEKMIQNENEMSVQYGMLITQRSLIQYTIVAAVAGGIALLTVALPKKQK